MAPRAPRFDGGGSGSGGGSVPTTADFPIQILPAGDAWDTSEALVLKANAAGVAFNVQQLLQARPVGTPWTMYFRFQSISWTSAYLMSYFLVKDSGTGKFVAIGYNQTGGASVNAFAYDTYNSATVRASFYNGVPLDQAAYYSVQDDGTDFIVSGSPLGLANTFTPLFSVANNLFLATYDQIGFGASAYNNAALVDEYMCIDYFSATAR